MTRAKKCNMCGRALKKGGMYRAFTYLVTANGTRVWTENAEREDRCFFCPDCIEEIEKFILNESKSHPDAQAKKERLMVRTERDSKIDKGTVKALSQAGWSAEKIADEVDGSIPAVKDIQTELRAEGQL